MFKWRVIIGMTYFNKVDPTQINPGKYGKYPTL